MRQLRRGLAALLLLVAPAAPAATYGEALADLDATLAQARAEVQRHPDSWASRERVADLYLRRAQLTGDYENYALAATTLDEIRDAPVAAACAGRARLAFAVHRLAATLKAIGECARLPGADAELRGLAAEVALYSGRYDAALAQMRALLAEQETVPALARLSRTHFAFGHRSEALALLDRAERLYFGDSAQLRAWLKLQRAVIHLESGQWEEALAHLLAGERELSGWWLIEEHIAEVKALLGREDQARAAYRTIVERTGFPEYVDALAALSTGPERDALAARADATFRARLARWPEAAAGHALDHFLRFGRDPAETVRLAEANVRARPYAQAQTQLAQAYLEARRPRDARRLIAQVLKTPWDTAELHEVAAQVYEAVGEPVKAREQRALALERNPRAVQQYRRVTLP